MRLVALMLGILALAWDGVAQQAAVPPPDATVSLDFEFFRTRVQPIFLKKRPGHARCITCHRTGQPPLVPLAEGQATWNEEESRKNFEVWQRVVAPGRPDASRLLLHPLAKSAGGDVFHAGGRHWDTKSDPEWQTLAAWVRGEKVAGAIGTSR